MDRLDKRIINLLQQDGRLTTAELAEQVGLSPSPCARRLKRLENDGIIRGYKAIIDRDKLGLGMTVFVNIRLNQHQDKAIAEFEAAIVKEAKVVNCHVISGSYDYLMEIICADLAGYEIFMRHLNTLPAVQDINSSFAIRAVKTNAALPLNSE